MVNSGLRASLNVNNDDFELNMYQVSQNLVRIFEDCFLNILLDRLQRISLGEILEGEDQ